MLAPPRIARGFLAGIVRKKVKLNLISDRWSPTKQTFAHCLCSWPDL
jgi:hypothetical protein